jgi:hypothetical protein
MQSEFSGVVDDIGVALQSGSIDLFAAWLHESPLHVDPQSSKSHRRREVDHPLIV